MAYIVPDSTIRILKNVPILSDRRNTLYFTTATAQEQYFFGLQKYAREDYTYLRQQQAIRVDILADNLLDCNYLMFKNSAFGNKWFYAFITNIEYVSNNCSIITYDIDEMQTFLFDYTLKQCFVEREHSETDNFGENLVDEGLDPGEYVVNADYKTQHFANWNYVAACTFNDDDSLSDAVGREYMGIYSGLVYNVFTDSNDLTDFIERAVEAAKSEGIIALFMMPEDFIDESGTGAEIYNITINANLNNIDGYVPRNKKLFCYPYNFLVATNLQGQTNTYRYEFFSGVTANDTRFKLLGGITASPEFALVPQDYKGVSDNWNEHMILSGVPVCAYTTDTYKAWLAQNSGALTSTIVNAGVGLIAGVVAAKKTGSVGDVVNPALEVINILGQYNDKMIAPPTAGGSAKSNILKSAAEFDFHFYLMNIRKEYAQIIDGYFDMYGYATRKVKVPNTHSRPHWNYVKTVGCTIGGSVPAEYGQRIVNNFDRGITFWKNGSGVGNYSLNNSPS